MRLTITKPFDCDLFYCVLVMVLDEWNIKAAMT